MAIDKDKLLAAIEAQAEHAYGSEQDSTIANKRAELIEAYLGMNTNPAPEGRSQVVDRAVFETVQTTIPSIVRIFAGTDDPVRFTPVGPEDEKAAEQTTQYVNYVVCQRNPWEAIVADITQESLLLPNAYAHVYWDMTERWERETYEGQTDAQIAVLLQDEGVSVLQHSQQPDTEQDQANAQAFQQQSQQWQQMAMQAQQQAAQTGQPPQLPPQPQPPEPAFLHDVVIERTAKEGALKVCVLPPEHCIVSSDTPDWTLIDCPYFEYRQQKSLAEVQAMMAPYGVKVPDDISDATDDSEDSPEGSARDRFGENWLDEIGDDRKLWVRQAWVRCAAEDDNERLYSCILVGKTILWAEAIGRIPVVSFVTQPMPHRHPGMSLAEMVKEVQDIKTAIKRGALDSLYLANSGRHAVSNQVNLDDLLDSRPGGVVRMLSDGALPGEGHIVPLTHPFVFDSVIGSLEYFDQDRQNVGGVNRYFSGTDAGAINKTASGTMALQNMSAQRVEHIARIQSAAYEHLFSIVQELLAKHQNKRDVIRLRGQWVEVDPIAWKTRRDCKISVGVGAGNKESMLQNLMMTFQKQMALLPMGLATRESIHATVIEEAKLQGFSNPEKFWPDPAKLPPPQPQPPPEVQVEQMRLQADQQKFQAQAQLDHGKAQMEAQQAERDAALKLQLEREKADQDAALEKYKAELQAQTQLQIEQIRLGMQVEVKNAEMAQERELAQFQAQSKGQLDEKLARMAKEPDAQVVSLAGELRQNVDALAKLAGAARKLRRGADGKPEGVDVIDDDGAVISSRNIVRDQNGLIVGLQ